MDLIGELIKNKRADEPLPIKEMLTELINYEKLSRNDKFKHLSDNPLLQKKLPLCWKAFEGDTRMYWLLNELSTIMQTISERDLDIFADVSAHYTAKQHRQIAIVGNSMQYRFRYYTLDHLTANFDYDDAIYLTDDRGENTVYTAIIQVVNSNINVYIGAIISNDSDNIDDDIGSLEPFSHTVDERTITIPTYSVQGNNDYPFASTKYHTISMPTPSSIAYQPKFSNKQIIVDLTKGDVQTLSFNSGRLTVLAEMLLRYEPEPDEKTLLRERLEAKRVHNDED